MELIINMRNGIYITKLTFVFLVIVQSQDSPQGPLRILLEKITPMLNKNLMNAKTITVRKIVTISMSLFNSILSD